MSERIREYFHLLWLAAIVVCAAAAIFAVLFVSCTRVTGSDAEAAIAEAVQETDPTATPEPTPSPTPEPVPTELQETEDMGEAYLAKCVFLGDSTTYGAAVYEALPWPQVWTTSIGTMDLGGQSYVDIDVYAEDGSVQSLSIRDAVAEVKPEILVITLGLNGISYMDESQFKEEYTDLVGGIQAASPDTKIICHSMYPVNDSQAPTGINNAGVNQANQWIYEVAEATGTRYLNTHDLLMDETGNLNADYGNGDGVHLGPSGFEVMKTNVRTHGYK